MRNIILIILISNLHVFGQDANYSLPLTKTLYDTPSEIGSKEIGWLFHSHYRSFWGKIVEPYNTKSILLGYRKNKISLFFQTQVNDAGIGTFCKTNVLIGVNYHLKTSSNSRLSNHISIGGSQLRLKSGNLIFEDMFNGSSVLSPSQENVSNNEWVPDLNYGLSFNKKWEKTTLLIGGSLKHLLASSSDIYENNYLYKKLNGNISVDRKILNKLNVGFLFFNQYQNNFKDIMFGAYIQKRLINKDFQIGVLNRYKESIIPFMQMRIDGFKIGISYDVSISSIASVNRGMGGMEVYINYNFKKRSKRKKEDLDFDKDGILNQNDSCVYVFGLLELNGCPDRDNDSDGVMNLQDKCPFVKGLVSFKGCPGKDTDGDGILDIEDSCVTQYGLLSLKGCPIEDSDEDGIPNSIDLCPNIKGSINYMGCTEPIEEKIPNHFDQEFLNVYFDHDSYSILSFYRHNLLSVGKYLIQHKTKKVFIIGHTDSDGTENYNFKLGMKRALEVQSFLRLIGVSDEQLVISTFGEFLPDFSNVSEGGKSLNRRVELKISGY
mgnify:CR=1 FL=1|tara:strand:+ start:1073 stop:2716 length:1644 start_codon:yes stop_codon:yes gene_type:complete